MVRVDRVTRDLARKLTVLSLEDGSVSVERVAAILQSIRSRPRHQLRPLLKIYLNYIRREIRKSQAIVEYAGPLTEERLNDLERAFSDRYGRVIETVTEENPELIAGVRVTVGDDVWDASIKGRLERLARSA